VQEWPEALSRAAISYAAPKGSIVARLIGGAGGMNTSRANAFIAEAARDVNAGTAREYGDLARALVMRRMANPLIAGGVRAAAPVVGQESAR
jgi:hypothetical protein